MNCTHCNEPVVMRCRKHRKHLCGDAYCVNLHRWPGGNCMFVDPSHLGPMDWMAISGAAVVLLVLAALVWRHA